MIFPRIVLRIFKHCQISSLVILHFSDSVTDLTVMRPCTWLEKLDIKFEHLDRFAGIIDGTVSSILKN